MYVDGHVLIAFAGVVGELFQPLTEAGSSRERLVLIPRPREGDAEQFNSLIRLIKGAGVRLNSIYLWYCRQRRI